MKLFFDVIFALLPLLLVVVPIVALIVLRSVLAKREKQQSTREHEQH